MAKSLQGATTFDRQADRYHRARPGYPQALIEEVLRASDTPPNGRILEIGCGTGKATLPFARRGHRMTCLDPGAHLIDVARAGCASLPEVEFRVTRFEDWTLEPGAFDLVISAQAFHWVDQEASYARAAACLRPGGGLALFWNREIVEESELRSRLDAAYARHAPHMARSVPNPLEQTLEEGVETRLESTVELGPVHRASFPSSQRYATDAYIELLRTHSPHALLPEADRTALLDEIASALMAHGGHIVLHRSAELYLARRVAAR